MEKGASYKVTQDTEIILRRFNSIQFNIKQIQFNLKGNLEGNIISVRTNYNSVLKDRAELEGKCPKKTGWSLVNSLLFGE